MNLRRGQPTPLAPPVEGFAEQLAPFERAMLDEMLAYTVVGASSRVRQGLQSVIDRTGADELMITSQIHDHSARLRSYEMTAEVRSSLAATVSQAG